jgi:hypothetical protein
MVFWVLKPRSSEKVRRFGGMYWFYLHSRKVNQIFWFPMSYFSTLTMESLYSSELRGITSQTRHSHVSENLRYSNIK